jgi:hypothetical protein
VIGDEIEKSDSGEGTCAAAPEAKHTSSGRDSSRSSSLVLQEDTCPCFAGVWVVLGELGPGIGGWGGQLTRASRQDLRSDGGLGQEPPREAQKVNRKVLRFNDANCGDEADWRSTGCVGVESGALWPPPGARRMRLLKCLGARDLHRGARGGVFSEEPNNATAFDFRGAAT